MRDPQQTKPWYREPWPWILMALPMAAVIGSTATAFIAVVKEDPLVVDNYYKEGLAINQVLARDHLAAQGQYRAQLLFSEDHSLVRLHLTSNGAPLPDAVQLQLVHPSKAELDRKVALKAGQAGWYEGSIAGLQRGARWQLQVQGGESGQGWRLTGDWRTAEGNAVTLEPRS
jgi:hypothetical protein